MEYKFNIQDIMRFLPHRYPFLLIDRILELVPKEKAIALKNVSFNEPFFQGHFPNIPIMPGVLILEAMAQAGGVLSLASLAEENQDSIFYLTGVDKARFRKPVVPGDQIIFEVKLLKMRAKAMKMSGVAMVDNQKVAEAEFMASVGEKI